MAFFLGLSLIAGLLTVLAPCVLPLLPVIVGETLAGERSIRRAVVTILSLGASLFVFTLALKASTAFAHVPLWAWSALSGGLLIIFGLLTLFPNLWDRLPIAAALNRNANRVMGKGFTAQSAWGDVIVGAALGPVFSSCSPTYFLILATVLPVSFSLGILYLCVYIAGLCIALFAIALLGQRLVAKLDGVSDPNGWFKRALGALLLLIGILVVTGLDKKVEAGVAAHIGAFDVTRIEQSLLLWHDGDAQRMPVPGGLLTLAEKAQYYQKAPELAHPDAYLNTGGQPITIGQFKGKDVVLVDFWTYSCINCQRTIPYLNQWYAKYKDQGLVIIGVHTPEFSFEHIESNVAAALKQFNIQYPVVLDNEYATWNAFGNQFWPREYLIDIDGYIVHDHAGEGDYDVTERAIQAALAERALRLGTATSTIATSTVSIADPHLDAIASPETYFGSNRNEFFGNGVTGMNGTQAYALPQGGRSPNEFYLDGTWTIQPEYATSGSAGSITYTYSAHDVYLVASAPTPVTITVLRDGKPVGSYAGSDVDPKTSTAVIHENRLYRLVHDADAGAHTIQIQVSGPGLQAYTFTFG